MRPDITAITCMYHENAAILRHRRSIGNDAGLHGRHVTGWRLFVDARAERRRFRHRRQWNRVFCRGNLEWPASQDGRNSSDRRTQTLVSAKSPAFRFVCMWILCKNFDGKRIIYQRLNFVINCEINSENYLLSSTFWNKEDKSSVKLKARLNHTVRDFQRNYRFN